MHTNPQIFTFCACTLTSPPKPAWIWMIAPEEEQSRLQEQMILVVGERRARC